MKILSPTLSERYKTQVEAERRYVSATQHEKSDVPTNQEAGGLPSSKPSPTIEEAFRSARTENKNTTQTSS